MKVRRFFCGEIPAVGAIVALGADAARHGHVLRLSDGDPLVLFDGHGREAKARVLAVSPMELRCIVEAFTDVAVGGPRVTLVQGVPKGSKLDGIVRMTTECGVSAIHLATTERSEVRIDGARAARRMARLERVAHEAARQAGRSTVPPIVAPAALDVVAARAPHGATRLVSLPGVQEVVPVELREDVWIVVGPEGGLGPAEERALEHFGYKAVSLGRDTLRVETAAVVAVSAVLLAPRFCRGNP